MALSLPARATMAWGRPVIGARAAPVALLGAVLAACWPGRLATGCALAASAYVVLLLADLALAPRPARLGVARTLPATVTMGSRAEVSWSLVNPTRLTVTMAVADELAPSLGASARRVWARLAPGQQTTLTATLRPERRGRFVPSEVVVRANGPLGLMARQSARQLPQELRVYPLFGSRRQADLLTRRPRLLELGLRSAKVRGGATEFEQLRDYSVDDDTRRIDWAATARADKPIARTYRAERNQRLICLLDNGRAMAAQVAGVDRCEHAIDAIMMLTAVAAGLGDMPGLVVFDTQVRAVVPPRAGRSQLGRVTEALYQVRPLLAHSDYRGAFTEVVARFQRRAMLCLLTELDEALVGDLLPALPVIAKSHILLVGALPDPQVTTWAAQGPADLLGAYRSAAAVNALSRRRQLARLLQARGATVVDAPPGQLASRLTGAYLDAKATGRL